MQIDHKNNKIVAISESELERLYYDRCMDEIMSLEAYIEMFRREGCVVRIGK